MELIVFNSTVDGNPNTDKHFTQHIVGISAHCQTNDIQLGLDAGMNDFCSKPVTMNDLKRLQESSIVQDVGHKLDQIFLADQSSTGVGTRNNDDTSSNEETSSLPLFNCLIGAESNSNFSQLVQLLDSTKWKVVTVHDGTDALNLLKIQNWDLVILDEELPRLSGTRCAKLFRDWEKCHRINKQRNMVLASAYNLNFEDDNGSSDTDDGSTTKHILLPFGFEHLVEKPYQATACEKFIQQTEENYTNTLTGVDIIAH